MVGAVPDTTETRIEVLKLNELPAVPAVAHQFIQAVEDPDIEVRQLAAIIERDPALTARIIGLANAAYFGVSERVTSVEHAIFKVLGINTAKSLALSIVLSGPLQAGRCPGFDLERYWSTAVLAATAAQRIAPFVRAGEGAAASEAYLGGLLHGLGLLAVAHLYPGPLSHALNESGGDRTELLRLEREALGADHSQVGGWVARKWHLPPPVASVISHHADAEYDGTYWPLVRLVGGTLEWVRELDREVSPDPAPMEALGIPPERVAKALEAMPQWREEVATMARFLAEG